MKKIKTLFVRDFIGRHTFVITDKVTEGCEWVLDGEGVATRKYDGTCCLIKDGEIYKRFDYKPGRTLPNGAIPCEENPDEVTGHLPYWVKCDVNNPSDKWHIKAFQNQSDLEDGTYELCGEHFQNNIDNLVEKGDILIKHGCDILDVPRNFEGIKVYLQEHEIEGLVFHKGTGEMCKIKRSDFGFTWGNTKRR